MVESRHPTSAPTPELDLGAFEALTFDCYGTLIDWETGLLAALRPVLTAHGVDFARGDLVGSEPTKAPRTGFEEELLEAFGRHEAALESGRYLPYREVLAGVLGAIGDDLRVSPTP